MLRPFRPLWLLCLKVRIVILSLVSPSSWRIMTTLLLLLLCVEWLISCDLVVA